MKKILPRFSCAATLCAALTFAVSGASSAHAADFTWQSNDSADWLTAGNWTSGTVPGGTNGPSADRAVFDGVGSQNAVTFGTIVGTTPNSVGGGSGFGGILVTENQTSALSINNSAGASRNFRFVANAGITIESGAGAFSMGTSGTVFQLVFQGVGSVPILSNDSSNTATLGSLITILPGGSQSTNLQFAGSGDWDVGSVILGGRSMQITKTGSGTVTLTGSSTYSGGTTINGGILQTGNSKALGTGAVTVGGGTLQVGDGTVNSLTGIGGLTLNNATSVLDLKTNGGSVSLASGKNFTMSLGTWALNENQDQIVLSGAGTYALTSGTIDLSGFTAGTGTYSIIVGTGTADNAALNFINGQVGDVYSFDTNGNLIVAVPEPSTFALAGIFGFGMLLLFRRRSA